MNSFEAWNFLQFQCYQYDSQPNYPDKYGIIVIHAKEKRWRNALRGHWTKRSSTFFINKMAREMFPGDSSLFDNVLYWFVLVFPFFFSIFSFFYFFFFSPPYYSLSRKKSRHHLQSLVPGDLTRLFVTNNRDTSYFEWFSWMFVVWK